MTRLTPLLLLLGCAHAPRNVYLRALDNHTEMAVVYRGFGTALRMRATYLSESFRTSMAEERRRLVGVDEVDHERFLGLMQDDGSAYHEVVFTAESDIEAVTRFGDNDDVWQLRLLADGVEEQLVTVYQVRRPNALHEQLYAHMNLWNELWIARFSRTVAAPQEVRLVVGSGYGHDELVWSGEQLR